MKKIFNLFLLLLLAAGIVSTFGQTQEFFWAPAYRNAAAQPQLSPHNTIVVFDWNKVIVREDWGTRLWLIAQHFPELLAAFDYALLQAPRDINAARKKHQSFELIFQSLWDTYPKLRNLEQLALDLGNTQIVVPEMQRLIDELVGAGYKLGFFSNIGPKMFDDLLTKHDRNGIAFADVLGKFAYVQTAHAGESEKPQASAYALFQKRCPAGKYLIFIDDKHANVKIIEDGHAPGFVLGILFANPEQLHAQLAELGILPEAAGVN